MAEIERTDAEWRDLLSPEQFEVLRRGGTERAWTGKYVDESGSGWPSFYEPKVADAVELIEDRTHGMVRTEVRCRRCGSHLGHVFPDGPRPTGDRYCMNSLSLKLEPSDASATSEPSEA